MHEVVTVTFGNKTFKDILRGSWTSTVTRIINRNENRAVTKAWQNVQQMQEVAKDSWIVRLYRCNARQVPVEMSGNMTVTITKEGI